MSRPNPSKKFMSIFDLSENTANSLYSISNLVVLLASIAGVAGAIGLFWAGGLKEKYSDIKELQTQERITESHRVAAQADARAAEANLAAEQLRAKLAWRVLTPEQHRKLAERMTPWAKLPVSGGQMSVAVFSTNGSFESTQLANQLASSLGSDGAGCAINRYPVTYGLSFSVSGVAILTSSSPRGIEVATALVDALREVGISAGIATEKRASSDSGDERFDSAISVMVGDLP